MEGSQQILDERHRRPTSGDAQQHGRVSLSAKGSLGIKSSLGIFQPKRLEYPLAGTEHEQKRYEDRERAEFSGPKIGS